ncbi:MAG: heavy-metal-associated domain-containing protein [Lachnospiraceae bacterium]|nr:heavy-metal-associated domain-containing protein [Lachnospiraceae bacterium]
MKKVFKLEELDCANCAAKMERAAAKVNGVNDVQINFMSQKLTLDADDDSFESVLDEVEKVMKKVEKDVSIIR